MKFSIDDTPSLSTTHSSPTQFAFMDAQSATEGKAELLQRTRGEIAHLAKLIGAKQEQCEALESETLYFQQYAGSMMDSGMVGESKFEPR